MEIPKGEAKMQEANKTASMDISLNEHYVI